MREALIQVITPSSSMHLELGQFFQPQINDVELALCPGGTSEVAQKAPIWMME